MNYHVQTYINGDILFAIDTDTTKQVGTGGDDKVGIYIGLMALLKFEKIKIAYFRDEERGCIGSGLADMRFFDNVGFVLQADRRGRYDITDKINGTPVLNADFKAAFAALIEKHKRVYVTGAMTDVIALVKNGLPVCTCNISCGYYEPHTNYEVINILHVQETRDFVFDLLEGVGLRQWPFPDREQVKEKETHVWHPNTTYNDSWNNDGYARFRGTYTTKNNNKTVLEQELDFITTPKDYCQACGEYMDANDMSRFHGFCKKCITDITNKANDNA
jgi:di/tripeptidase